MTLLWRCSLFGHRDKHELVPHPLVHPCTFLGVYMDRHSFGHSVKGWGGGGGGGRMLHMLRREGGEREEVVVQL